MAFFDDEEEKRKLLLTPGINPKLPLPPLTPAPSLANLRIAPPSLAKLSPGAMTPAPTASTPDASSLGLLPSPGAPQLTKASQLYNAKADYLEKTPGRFKSGLLNAAKGAVAGLAGGGGLGGALGGALSGGLVGGIAPKLAREAEFNQRIKPQILERFALEDQDRAAGIAAEKAAREDQIAQANIANIGSQIQSRQAADALNRNKPIVGKPGEVGFKPGTYEKVFEIPAADKTLSGNDPRLSIEPSSGKSFEQIAEESYQGRGGDKYVFDRLPERTRQLLNGSIPDADPQEVEAANRAFQSAIQRERKAILDYTRGDVRSRALGARKSGGAKPTASAGQRKATVGPDFVNHVASKLGVSPEKAKQMIEADGYTVK